MFFNSADKSVFHFIWIPLLCVTICLSLSTSIFADDKSKDEDTLSKSATVLKDMLHADSIPKETLAQANCIVILPNVKKAGFIVGGTGGRGAMTCRSGNNFRGKWSAPAMYTITGASFGLQVGGSSTDFVILVMSKKGVEAVLQGATKFGNDATVAAGPTGATTAGTVGGSDMLTYGRAKGIFAGMSLGGATLSADNDANQRLYGKSCTPKDIVLENAVNPTPAGQNLVSLLSGIAKRTE